jgi:exonuclease VII large subunit
MEQSIAHNIYKVNSLGSRLESNSLKSVLNRGFSYTENLIGNIIDRADKLQKDDLIKIVFQDGKKITKVQE